MAARLRDEVLGDAHLLVGILDPVEPGGTADPVGEDGLARGVHGAHERDSDPGVAQRNDHLGLLGQAVERAAGRHRFGAVAQVQGNQLAVDANVDEPAFAHRAARDAVGVDDLAPHHLLDPRRDVVGQVQPGVGSAVGHRPLRAGGRRLATLPPVSVEQATEPGSGADEFGPDDDAMHAPGDSFYETETFWYSFFVPERGIGAWLYGSVRPRAGVSAGGMWMWDGGGAEPRDLLFYNQFSFLKLPTVTGPERVELATGLSITCRTPLMSYDLRFEDRERIVVDLRFDAVEPPVPLLSGTPPYPRAHHFDQTGRVVGSVVLDGETMDVDCHAMRDRSWGPRPERGYRRVGYTWGADADTSFLAYSTPDHEPSGSSSGRTGSVGDVHEITAGYLRRDGTVARLVEGRRTDTRDQEARWVTGVELDAVDELGRRLQARGTASTRMVLTAATSICINTLLEWDLGGHVLAGEDQDVWPLSGWSAHRRPRRAPGVAH